MEMSTWVNIFSEQPSSELFLGKGILKICRTFTGGHPCRSVISIKLQSNFIEITLRHGYSPVNFLNIFKTPLPKNRKNSQSFGADSKALPETITFTTPVLMIQDVS